VHDNSIAELAGERPHECFTALNHYLTVDWLKAAHERVKPDSAPGVDGQSWSDYGKKLEENLRGLLDRAKSGSYVAAPVKRVHIPKGDGKETRGIGMPTIEDKVLQRAITMLLEPIYEQDFKCYSYGFRRIGTRNPIVLVLVVLLLLENAETGWDVEDENENGDEDETSVPGEGEPHHASRFANNSRTSTASMPAERIACKPRSVSS